MKTLDYINSYHKNREVIPAWEEGANAYNKGLSIRNNPYEKGTADYLSWRTAFIETRKTYKRLNK